MARTVSKKAVTKLPAQKKSAAPKKVASSRKNDEKTGEQLVIENFATLTCLVEALSETLDVLVQKAENMACHIIATEEVLAELVASEGLDLARVNARIRAKVAAGTDGNGDPSRAIDIAASIASPLPRR